MNTLQSSWGLPEIKGHHKCGNCVVCPLTSNTQIFVHGTCRQTLNSFSNCNTKMLSTVYGVHVDYLTLDKHSSQ